MLKKHVHIRRIAAALLCLAAAVSCSNEETSLFIGDYSVSYHHHHTKGAYQSDFVDNGTVSIEDAGDGKVKLSGYVSYEGRVTDDILQLSSFKRSGSGQGFFYEYSYSFEPAIYNSEEVVINMTVKGFSGPDSYNEKSSFILTKKSK
jgi:hypothetical protein